MVNAVRNQKAELERERREEMWAAIRAEGLTISPRRLRELGAFGGAQGVWYDAERTAGIGGVRFGVTVGLLHTGEKYDDDLSDSGVLYHFPSTGRRGKDAAEIDATKAAGDLGLAVFVITKPSATTRRVFRGFIEGYDELSGLFLVTFRDDAPQLIRPTADEETFELFDSGSLGRREVTVREGQQRFKFRVLQRYGPRCAMCTVAVLELLDAAHIVEKRRGGSDDPRNGLVLCANHHRAFDRGYISIEPTTLELRVKPGTDATDLGMSVGDIRHLRQYPHRQALESRWVGSTVRALS